MAKTKAGVLSRLQVCGFWLTIVILVMTNDACKHGQSSVIELTIGSSNMLTLEDGGTVKVNFVYTTSSNNSNVTVKCEIDTGLEFPVNLDRHEETGSVIVDSFILGKANTEFGTYLLTLTLQEDNRNYTKDMVLFYEEPITGFKVTTNNYTPYQNQEVKFEVSFSRGSNVEIEWFFENDPNTCLVEYSGIIRHEIQTHIYHRPGTYIVSVIAANEISRTFVQIPIMVKRRPIPFIDRIMMANAKVKQQGVPSFKTVTLYPNIAVKM